ncbi:hypothetical protein KR222_010414, partial [Zaprionus bogoriensis]
SDSEEDELDQRGLSPRTRMSITGLRPADMSGDSSEIDYSEEDDDAVPVATNDDAVPPRYNANFAQHVEDALHSTLSPFPPPTTPSYDSAVILSDLEASSGSIRNDDSYSDNNNVAREPPRPRHKSPSYSPRSSAGAPRAKAAEKKLVQPTITAAIKKTAATQQRSLKGDSVSQEFYDKESGKLAELRAQLHEAVKLYDNMSHKLPDKGIQMRKRVERLQQDIAIKEKYLQGLNVQRVPKIRVSDPQSSKPRRPANDTPDWEKLSADINRIKPTHTGAQGMATFNANKALTIDALKNLHGSLKSSPGETVLATDPPGLKVKLMDHQKHALAWMTWREKQRPRGGILADDMGLGKTLTMIALVLAGKTKLKSSGAPASSDDDDDEDAGRKRKSLGGWNSKGRKDNHAGGTLVICPASLLRQWEGEINSKLSRSQLSVCVHHGPNREQKAKQLMEFDVVVTTYNIASRDDQKTGPLYGVKWRRIILDEAHVVRNHKAQSSMAITELRGKYRWALTGTPIQNKELDVYALLKFLRCSPFDDLNVWKTWIDNKVGGGQERLNLLVKSLMLRRTKAQLQLNGKLNNLPKKEIRLIEMSLDTDEMNVYQRVLTYSRSLFAQFLFQRAERDSDANFLTDAKKPTQSQKKDPNGAFYKMHEKFARMAGQSKEVKSHEILVLLLRLRQICCHPGLIDSMLEGDDSSKLGYGGSDENTPEIDLLAQLNKLSINDSGGSSRRSSGSGSSRDEARLAKASQNVLKRSNPVFNLKRPSSKMLKVQEILEKYVLKSKDKAIVVSQWTSVLDIMRDMLKKEKVDTLSLNGTIPVKDRQNIVDQFNDPNNAKRILLLSLTAGGVGLNLIGANHLILLDLHWNPQLEAQAQDRIYRVGQKKNVVIYKIVCVDTVEQRIKALQDRKLELADGVLTGKVSSKLTIDDLKGLFGM